MKKAFILTTVILLALNSFSQTIVNPCPRTITVTGSAEMEVIPDEIYVLIDLKEYEKKGSGKVGIDKIKQDFLTAARRIGISDSAISIAAYDGNNGNPWLRKKNKKAELYASVSYLVKVKTSAETDRLVDILDDNATQNFYIQKAESSRIEEYRRQLKIQAVKAAKEKAGYLTAAIGETAGVVVTINEPTEFYTPYMPVSNFALAKAETAGAANDPQAVDFKKIKLRYEVSVVFAIK
jgi:uncharacterized protein YggE